MNIAFLLVIYLVLAATGVIGGSNAGKAAKRKKEAAPHTPPRTEQTQWHSARKKQADAEQIHASATDCCEARLENLKILHEAGILDEVEYRERVERVRKGHALGTRG